MPSDSRTPDASESRRYDVDEQTPLAELRRWVRELTGPIPDLELLLTELVTNAQQHGAAGPITVEIKPRDTNVAVVVTNSRPLPVESLPIAAASVDVLDVRGRGLQIAAAVADELRIEQIGHTLRISAVVPRPSRSSRTISEQND